MAAALPKGLIKKLEALSKETRAKVEGKVRAHLAAYLKNGSPDGSPNLERIYEEAIDTVKVEEKEGSQVETGDELKELRRDYGSHYSDKR